MSIKLQLLSGEVIRDQLLLVLPRNRAIQIGQFVKGEQPAKNCIVGILGHDTEYTKLEDVSEGEFAYLFAAHLKRLMSL